MNQNDPCDILIVEDNPADAELTVRSLKTYNLANRIYIAEDGAEALDFILCKGRFSARNLMHPPKVVFLDLKLPKINGFEVLKEVRSNPATKMLPVVVITSSREDSDIKSAYNLGANSYVVKPVDFDVFNRVINLIVHYWLLINEPSKNNSTNFIK